MRLQRAHIASGRAFTLIELLVAILIIAVLIGLLLVGVRQATRGARGAAETQDLASMRMAVETFRRDFGFIPPLVKDGYAGTPGQGEDPLRRVGSGRRVRLVPNVYSTTDPIDLEFLRGASGNPDMRFSVHSIPYYIMTALGERSDFVEGPGAHEPAPDGSFKELTNRTYQPLFDPTTARLVQVGDDPEEGRIELQDARGAPYRYYRWEPAVRSTPGFDPDDPIANLRIPSLVGGAAAAAESIDLRSARYAIVGAGPDGVFGDVESKERIEEALGASFATAEEARAAAREDNVITFGN